jgi:hypothetical protein
MFGETSARMRLVADQTGPDRSTGRFNCDGRRDPGVASNIYLFRFLPTFSRASHTHFHRLVFPVPRSVKKIEEPPVALGRLAAAPMRNRHPPLSLSRQLIYSRSC